MTKKVLVLGGGTSNEREISLRSGNFVLQSLKKAGFEANRYDTKKGLEGILKSRNDIIFPMLHGTEGEDGVIQENQIKYLGSDSLSSKLCFDKITFKKLMTESGILTPECEEVHDGFLEDSDMIDNPFVLKPISGGSSIDTFIIRQGDDVDLIPEEIFKKYHTMLLEELIIGTEITIAVLDGKALPVIEIIPPEHEEFDYENKYNGKTQEICPASSLSQQVQNQAKSVAEKVHQICGARHFSRIDILVTPDNDMYVLELNTIPGMTEQSLFPLAAKTAGISMPELVRKFVELVKRDYSLD